MPQVKNTAFKLTAARVVGLAVLVSSKNINTAFSAAGLLANSDFASQLATSTGTAPARRDLLAVKPTDAYSPIYYDSALFAKSWMDPSSTDTDNIFSGMVENVISGGMTPADAISDASSKMGLLLLK